MLKKEFKQSQHRHKRQQALYDAIKASKTTESFATFHGKRFKLSAIKDDSRSFTGFVKLNGRVRLCWIVEKDGLKAITIDHDGIARGHSIHISGTQILCTAQEANI